MEIKQYYDRKGQTRHLRCGFTTGACAAAAARAAMTSLVNQAETKTVTITLPNGEHASFDVEYCAFDSAHSLCCVIKDAGDDPDITNGAEICAEVSWSGVTGYSNRRRNRRWESDQTRTGNRCRAIQLLTQSRSR